jgi:DNA (cytosine-5)-methyltransferase 1
VGVKINLLDLFSGIGGFHLGLERAGFEINSYNSEIDKYAIQVYKHNFKDSTYVGSVTDVRREQLPRINGITFGSPCQDFSLAGRRKGMSGERSSLILEAIRLIKECRPDFFIWENVKGTFSSNNRQDFAAILQTFTNIGGYRLEWQLLNTKWFLPQNRERVYLVGYLGDGSRGEVFPISEGSGQTNELQRQQANTCTLTTRYEATGNGLYIAERKQYAQIGAMRGRNPDNPSDRSKGAPLKQTLEINTDGVSNALTRVQKDNYVLGYTRDKKGKVVKRHKKYTANTIHSSSGGGGNTDQFVNSIRRLTPLECERLQGFPDNWTKAGSEGPISDTQRYKMCGNAVTVDVVKAVGERIKDVVYG